MPNKRNILRSIKLPQNQFIPTLCISLLFTCLGLALSVAGENLELKDLSSTGDLLLIYGAALLLITLPKLLEDPDINRSIEKPNVTFDLTTKQEI